MTSSTDDRLRRSFDYEAQVESVAVARRDVTGFVVEQLRSVGAQSAEEPGWLVERLALVVSELATNAVAAAAGRWFRVEVVIDGADSQAVDSADRRTPNVTCHVTNPRTGDDDRVPRFGVVPEKLAERGRGLMIVDGLVDRTRVAQSPTTTTVTAELTLAADHRSH